MFPILAWEWYHCSHLIHRRKVNKQISYHWLRIYYSYAKMTYLSRNSTGAYEIMHLTLSVPIWSMKHMFRYCRSILTCSRSIFEQYGLYSISFSTRVHSSLLKHWTKSHQTRKWFVLLLLYNFLLRLLPTIIKMSCAVPIILNIRYTQCSIYHVVFLKVLTFRIIFIV